MVLLPPQVQAVYSGSKFAIEGYSEALAQEIAPLGIKLTLVEPGSFRTGIADSLATTDDSIPDYERVHKVVASMKEKGDGKQPGDPDKAAQAMIKVVESENPPLRLALGEDALHGVRNKLKSAQKDLDAWEDTTLSTSFESAKL